MMPLSLMLSGWGQPADGLAIPGARAVDYMAMPTREHLWSTLHETENVETVIGWSLGGLLAVKALQDGVLTARHLILIAAPCAFIQRDRPEFSGMPPSTFQTFRDAYARRPEATLQRFAGLVARGDAQEKAIVRTLRHSLRPPETMAGEYWLDQLASLTLAPPFPDTFPFVDLLYGEADTLTPVAQGEWFAAHLPHARLHRIPCCGHAPHLHAPDAVTALLS